MTQGTTFENRTYEELKVGDEASLVRIAREEDFLVFATASGNHNPMHLAAYDGDGDGVPEAIAPSLWVGSLVSAVLGNLLPGAGTLYRHQSFDFSGHAQAGDELVVTVRVLEKLPEHEVRLSTEVRRAADGAVIVSGEALISAPTRKLRFDALDVPGLIVQRHRHFEKLVALAAPLDPLVTAVIAPEEPRSLGGALLAHAQNIITPILVGAPDRIAAAAAETGLSLEGVEIIDEPDHALAAHRAVDLVSDGRAGALMKGHLHTDDLLRAALRKERGLRAGRRFTHVFVMDVPGVPHPLLVTDAAVNIQPDLKTKVDIVQNAIDVAISIGIAVPRVGVLSAVETVNPDIPSSIDAALLSKMADRGQITGGLVDGPLAMDNAVDIGAARTKGITSEVAGRAEVLVPPDIDSANMLAKQLAYISHAEGAGLVLGASVPIILNSRSDGDMARLASCAVAALHHARIRGLTPEH
ncbi:bifunctional enoyl-CoA hydratase/phosphate acetyltransferase [Tropicimonas aquimaris]|uniref:Bifunctional enoyl-CoA hydratase/phosphate acetyltransferase n=1 Tax=Tropicimonas aquimaris TaxID=914152 RepID=A0ABW3INK2_9RHOB